MPRLTVQRSGQHLYAQVFTADGAKVLAVGVDHAGRRARRPEGHGKNKTPPRAVGKAIAERALAAGVEKVAFDRSGFRYHGRIKALAEAAREAGLKF